MKDVRLVVLPAVFFLAAVAAEYCAASAPGVPVLLTDLSCADGTNAAFVLRAWPGDYFIQTSASLAGTWDNETNISVGRGGAVGAAIPLLGRGSLFVRAAGCSPSDGAGCLLQCQTLGSAFAPEVHCGAASPDEFLWIWSDGTTSTARPVAAKDFGSPGARMQGLRIDPAAAITSINLGFDASDGADFSVLNLRPAQNVSAVRFPYPLPSVRYWASSFNPLTNTLDFTGFTGLEVIECYQCATLAHVVVKDLPSLRRACFECCGLRELDLSGDPNLEDLRGALNAYTNIILGGGTGPKIWHWCTRDNPQLTQRFADFMTNFYSLQELFIWNDNQDGEFKVGSTNLTALYGADNHFGSVDLSGQSQLWRCELQGNALTNLVLTGCSALHYLDAHNNVLGTNALDALLAELDNSAPALTYLDLSQNAQYPSGLGYAHYTNLVARGMTALLDWPPGNGGTNNVPGGLSAITFVTTSRSSRLQIQTANGSPASILWHWGDGTTLTGSESASHDFGSTGLFTNYVEVIPPGTVTYFGAETYYTEQGIKGVYGVTNFPNLTFLYLYGESLTDLSIAGCSNLVQLHFAGNPVSVEVCDQWFIDLDNAVPGPVTGADFYYPASRRSARSDAAWTSLVNKGYSMHPF